MPPAISANTSFVIPQVLFQQLRRSENGFRSRFAVTTGRASSRACAALRLSLGKLVHSSSALSLTLFGPMDLAKSAVEFYAFSWPTGKFSKPASCCPRRPLASAAFFHPVSLQTGVAARQPYYQPVWV